MAEDLFLNLDSNEWREFDFDDTDGITGTIYTDRLLTTAKDLTGFTLTIRLSKRWHIHDRLNKTATIISAGSGTWKYLPADGEMPRFGVYLLEIELSKSGVKKSTKPVEFYIRRGAGA